LISVPNTKPVVGVSAEATHELHFESTLISLFLICPEVGNIRTKFIPQIHHGERMGTEDISWDREQVTRAVGVVSLATLASRLLGAIRDILLASFLGAGMVSDAFIAAFRLPNFMRRLFGEGSLSIAFIPVFTDCLVHQGPEEARRLAAASIRLLALLLALLSLAGVVFAPTLVRLLAPGFSHWPAKYGLTVHLTGIMMPYIFFIGLVALCMGILNVLGHFAAPAAAPICLNLAMIGAMGLAAALVPDENGQAVWLAAGVVIGGGLQLGMQLPFLVHFKIRFWQGWRLWHSRIKEVLLLFGPVLFGAAVYQINSVILTLLATLLSQGSVSYLYYADRLVQLPLGVFAISTATAVLPTLTRHAAVRQWDALRATFIHSVNLVFFISLPSMVGLIVLRGAIVSMLFQRGAFDAHAAQLTADALLYYGMGLWSFAAVRIVLNMFYALKDTRTPVKVAVLTVVANVIGGVMLMGPMGHRGLALALTLASVVQLSLLVGVLRKKMGALGWRQMAFSISRSALCSGIMGGSVWAMSRWLLPADVVGIRLFPALSVCLCGGLVVFGVSARLLGAPELHEVMNLIFKKKAVS
jgi:putative peptidoglycan lipid II flippase